MKRLVLAGLLLLLFAVARAQQDDAYGSLVGMADAASSDRGPQAGEIPADGAPVRKPAARAEKRAAAREDDLPAVAVPAASAPRIWTRLFASLLPPMGRIPFFEISPSTAVLRRPRQAARPETAASSAGTAQGLVELVAAATAPILSGR